MDLVQRVARDLAADGEVESLTDTAFTVSRYRGREFAPPVALRLDGIAGYLESMWEDAVQVFPEVPVEEGAYRLLLVHLEESLLTTGGAPYRITVDRRGLTVSRADPDRLAAGTDDTAGDARSWTTEVP